MFYIIVKTVNYTNVMLDRLIINSLLQVNAKKREMRHFISEMAALNLKEIHKCILIFIGTSFKLSIKQAFPNFHQTEILYYVY